MLQVLFICTGNTCRSPMAEMLLKAKIASKQMAGQISVRSAGLAAAVGSGASRNSSLAMAARGLSLDGHRSSLLDEVLLADADLILTMTDRHKQVILQSVPEARYKVYTLTEYAGVGGEIADPFGGDCRVYEACAMELERCVDKIWDKIQTLAESK